MENTNKRFCRLALVLILIITCDSKNNRYQRYVPISGNVKKTVTYNSRNGAIRPEQSHYHYNEYGDLISEHELFEKDTILSLFYIYDTNRNPVNLIENTKHYTIYERYVNKGVIVSDSMIRRNNFDLPEALGSTQELYNSKGLYISSSTIDRLEDTVKISTFEYNQHDFLEREKVTYFGNQKVLTLYEYIYKYDSIDNFGNWVFRQEIQLSPSIDTILQYRSIEYYSN
ncbi:hypothetical protein [Sediminitomix flava]|uniref:Uncharacterized protein n=1 Tax=Sediminitomix flava TaxID=379075 RepID=A0A315YY81_SEDFL|nr:hypothetical protein [Sediminitomix flava]PWJ35023.1 hypothetical protein BC781_11064 [Sediminitomix flava]